jgi:flagellar motor protein MotB
MSNMPPNDPTGIQPPPGFAPPPSAAVPPTAPVPPVAAGGSPPSGPSAPKSGGSGAGKLLAIAAVALIVGLVAGFLVGGASKQGEIDDLETELASTEDEREEAEDEAEGLQDSNEELTTQVEDITSQLDQANAEIADLANLLEGAEAGLTACADAIPQIVALLDLDDLNTQFVDRMVAAINNGEDVQQPPLVDELNTLIDQIEALQGSINFDVLVACEDAVAA